MQCVRRMHMQAAGFRGISTKPCPYLGLRRSVHISCAHSSCKSSQLKTVASGRSSAASIWGAAIPAAAYTMDLESVIDFESLQSASGRFKNVPPAVCSALLAVASEMSRLSGVVQSKPNYSDLTAAVASKTTKQDLASVADGTLQRVQSIVDMSTAAREDLRVSTAADLRAMHERIASLEQTVATLSAQLANATAHLQDKVRLCSLQSCFTCLPQLSCLQADAADLAQYATVDALHSKADSRRMEAALESKASVESLRAVRDSCATGSDVRRLVEHVDSLASKAEVVAMFESAAADTREATHTATQAAQQASSAADSAAQELQGRPTHEQVQAWISAALHGHMDRKATHAAIRAATADLGKEVETSVRDSLSEVIAVVNDKAFKADVSRALAGKASERGLQEALLTKADRQAVSDALRRKADATEITSLQVALREVQLALADSASGARGSASASSTAAAVESSLGAVQREVRNLRDTLEHKVDVSDMQALAATVAALPTGAGAASSARGGGAAQGTQHSETDSGVQAVDDLVVQPRAVPAAASFPPGGGSARPRGAAARFLWKSKDLTDDGCVPWDVEVWNTGPKQLQWSPGDSVVIAERQGLYKISAGLFACAPPVVVLLVNGAPVATFKAPHVDGSSAVTSDGTAHWEVASAVPAGTCLLSHPEGTVGGLSILQFVALPAGARVALVYSGDVRGQGFLEITKQ